MSDAETVRASRDGDRFHYYWAARRALRLLSLTDDLEVVSVEGLPPGDEVDGEEVIDVGEFYGGPNMANCTRYRFAQLKHSTLRTDERIIASELKTTLEKFAGIYRAMREKSLENKLQFVFVANRELNEKVRRSLGELTAGAPTFSYGAEVSLLRRYMGFSTNIEEELDFCRRFTVEDGIPGIEDMQQFVKEELQQYLPGGGTGSEMAQLMETVSLRATSLADTQTLVAHDILAALRTTEDEVFPAPSAIEKPNHIIRTQAVDDVATQLKNGANNKLLITAVGGVGKSILTTIIGQLMPEGSVTIVYDCFAGGDYRRGTSQRHQHRVALTQISNELAAEGRCVLLIPTAAPESSYLRVFMRRVRSIAEQMSRDTPQALLTVVIDAADNAAIAASEQQQHTFVTDLFREDWPANTRLVQLCRPERRDLVNPPHSGVTELAHQGFRHSETVQHLRTQFPDATEAEGAELHALSGGNPRVQAMAMQNAQSVAEVLSAITIEKNRPADVLDSMIARQVHEIADHGHMGKDELERLCEALATLHPPMPLDDLAAITGLNADAIRSFAVALGRNMRATGNTLQFRDEPTETWFRSSYGPKVARRKEFTLLVEQLADTSPYAAGALPQLLFEANMLNKLVGLALSDAALPGEASDLQAREIARSRARYALCAMLRAERNADAARLAVKAGSMSSGHARTINVFRTHTDLTGMFLDASAINELCAGRDLATDWPGSSLHVEAALLSHIPQFQDDARARVRSAINNFAAIARLPGDPDVNQGHNITADEMADVTMALINVDGPRGVVERTRTWRPRFAVREVAQKLCARLADAGRYNDLDELAVAAKRMYPFRIGAAETMFDYNLVPDPPVLRRLVTTLRTLRRPFPRTNDHFRDEPDVRSVVWLLVHGLRAGMVDNMETLRILDVHLPDHFVDWAGSRSYRESPSSVLLGFALRARLTGQGLTTEGVASEKLRTLMNDPKQTNSQDVRQFKNNIGKLLPWAACWLSAILDSDTGEIGASLDALITSDLKLIRDDDTPFTFINTAAEIATRILGTIPYSDLAARFATWHRENDGWLARSRCTVGRIASRSTHLEEFGLDVAARGVSAAQSDRLDADSRIESLIELARTLLVNRREALAIFEMARQEADQVGDDLPARWQSLKNVAKALATGAESARAYRLFQIGEELSRSQDDDDTAELARRLLAMHEPTYFTVASRARDRRTLSFEAMITPVFASAGTADTSQLGRLALYPFTSRYAWEKTVSGLPVATAELASRVFEAFTSYRPSSSNTTSSPGASATASDHEKQTLLQGDGIANDDFTTTEAWNAALRQAAWDTKERLAAYALDRHPTRRADVLDAFGKAMATKESDYARIAEAAAQQASTPGLRAALRRLAETYATRFARQITTRSYDDPYIATVARASGIAEADLLRIGFQEVGRNADELDYQDYFGLAAHLAETLTTEQAATVFDGLAELFDDLAPPTTAGDGPYAAICDPPVDAAPCIAGVVWAALGDMSMKLRWNAAHTVLLLVQLDCAEELAVLARLAGGADSTALFVEGRFPFYALHARMWLLLALARAAKEPNAGLLTRFVPWLVTVVRGPVHAVNQVLAQRILTELVDRGRTVLDPGDVDALSQRVVATPIKLNFQQRHGRADPLASSDDESAEDWRYPFFLDFQDYWCNRVALIFGSDGANVARRAVEVSVGLDMYDPAAIENDARSAANVYDERHHYPDRGSWPRHEQYKFYTAIHALLTVAGEFAQSHTAYQEPDSPSDSYSEWLAEFLPKRPDGRWLADRRDPPPTPAPDAILRGLASSQGWLWTLSKDTFERMVGAGQDWVTVWASVDAASDELSEDVMVESALVPHETARSLMISLQTSLPGPFSFRMPTSNEPFNRPDEPPYELLPWLDTTEFPDGIDKRDVRGGDVRFPPVNPSADIISRFHLVGDEDQRHWLHDEIPVFRSRTWRNMREGPYGHGTGSSGDQLDVRFEFLKRVLQEIDKTLIVHVGIRRDRQRSYYQGRKGNEDEFDRLEWSGKVYLLDPQGCWLEY